MEIIIALVVLGLAAYWVYDMSQKKKHTESIEPWPYGEKLSEGKIHVKPADVAGSENRVETPTPALAVDGHGDVHEVKPTKKAPAKKTAAKKPAVAKKAPAKKKSV